MPNHITNKVSAPAHALTSLINADGRIDFGKVIKFEGDFPWGGVCEAAETAAESAVNLPLSVTRLGARQYRSSKHCLPCTRPKKSQSCLLTRTSGATAER